MLVGLDRCPKGATDIPKLVYREGMREVYGKDPDHYELIFDAQKQDEAIRQAEANIWDALPQWIPRRPIQLGTST